MNPFDFLALCGAMSPLGKLVLAGDLSIALAYFAIPIGLIMVLRKRLLDIPYPWMLALFAAFIVACGLTHLVHALQMPYTTFEHTVLEATVKTICAALSVVTAMALIAIVPRALRIASPRERALELEREVAARTAENVRLLREINHRLGNQLQIMGSLVRLERRKAVGQAERAVVERIGAVVSDLARSYHEAEGRYSGFAPEHEE
ncbi:MAG: histidine kinase dimerization/phosphoacceptor domain -containing protein [Beijerinckiaceae bacterium]|nr:histidine kinase dimerization/phosphoacceptor domain -containing protein [Beijerinckiaceae bacterium]